MKISFFPAVFCTLLCVPTIHTEPTNAPPHHSFKLRSPPPLTEPFALLEDRLLVNVTNRFNAPRLIQYALEPDAFTGIGPPGLIREMKSAVRGSVRMTLRELTLRKVVLEEIQPINWFEEKILSAFKNIFTGIEERDNLASPLRLEEGLPAADGIRRQSGLRAGARPDRVNDPYAYVSYGKRDEYGADLINMNLRCYYEEWRDPRLELIAHLPIRQWTLGGGMIFRTSELRIGREFFGGGEERVNGSVSIQGPLGKGELYFGLGLPNTSVFVSYARHR
ncbi:MAG: hypothetical protein Greene041679_211 [Parcubacteria group bacterium Greene0416_79]|nr:MAG: hypothetical protein Greene041679_211 [Parcubacteria group bacterium Greene0416_79]